MVTAFEQGLGYSQADATRCARDDGRLMLFTFCLHTFFHFAYRRQSFVYSKTSKRIARYGVLKASPLPRQRQVTFMREAHDELCRISGNRDFIDDEIETLLLNQHGQLRTHCSREVSVSGIADHSHCGILDLPKRGPPLKPFAQAKRQGPSITGGDYDQVRIRSFDEDFLRCGFLFQGVYRPAFYRPVSVHLRPAPDAL